MGGVGGAPRYVVNDSAKTIQVPDLRGCVAETTGGVNSPGVCNAQGDGIRNITGSLGHLTANYVFNEHAGEVGALFWTGYGSLRHIGYNADTWRSFNPAIDTSRIVPTFSVNRMKSFGVLTCVYFGLPK